MYKEVTFLVHFKLIYRLLDSIVLLLNFTYTLEIVMTTANETESVASEHRSMSKAEVTMIEDANPVHDPEYLSRYPLLMGKTEEELQSLNKSVLRKLDWKFLPCISMMLLMKCVTKSYSSL